MILPSALPKPALDFARIEPETSSWAVAISEGAELVRVVVDPLSLAPEEPGDRRRVEDPIGPSRRVADDPPLDEHVSDELGQRSELELGQPTSPSTDSSA